MIDRQIAKSIQELRELIYSLELVLNSAIAKLKKLEATPREIVYGGGARNFQYLQGKIANAQTPNTLLLDGSRAMTGNLNLATYKLLFQNSLIKDSGSAIAFRNLADNDYYPAYFGPIYFSYARALATACYINTMNTSTSQMIFRSYDTTYRACIELVNGRANIPRAGDITHYNGASFVRTTTGTYTGDGNATQAVTGVGFQPKVVEIHNQGAVSIGLGRKTDQDGLYTKYIDLVIDPAILRYELDHIISLDADGFTVGDGTGTNNVFNINLSNYTYICWG